MVLHLLSDFGGGLVGLVGSGLSSGILGNTEGKVEVAIPFLLVKVLCCCGQPQVAGEKRVKNKHKTTPFAHAHK